MFDFNLGGLAFNIMKINTGRKSSALAIELDALVDDSRRASKIFLLQSTIHVSLSFGDFFVSNSMMSATSIGKGKTVQLIDYSLH